MAIRTGTSWTWKPEGSFERVLSRFLIAVAFDRGMPWKKAWRIPTEIDRQGLLDSALLASKTESELVALLDGLAVRPRYAQSKAPGRCQTPPDWSGSGSAETPVPSGGTRLPPRWRRRYRRSTGSGLGSPRWPRGYSGTTSAASGGRSGRSTSSRTSTWCACSGVLE